MPLFQVELSARIKTYKRVEADNEDDAEAIGLSLATDDTFDDAIDWEVEGVDELTEE